MFLKYSGIPFFPNHLLSNTKRHSSQVMGTVVPITLTLNILYHNLLHILIQIILTFGFFFSSIWFESTQFKRKNYSNNYSFLEVWFKSKSFYSYHPSSRNFDLNHCSWISNQSSSYLRFQNYTIWFKSHILWFESSNAFQLNL